MRRAELAWLPIALLAGCGGGEPQVAGNAATPVVAVSPPATPVASPTPARPAVPDRVTVTTNEPFYAAVIEGDAIRLSGVDLPERRVPIVARGAVPGGTRWEARDAKGAVIATVTDTPCADDMSGEPRPFTGELRIDGRVAPGCAFPTPAATDTIPAAFHGRWDRDAAACAAPATSIEGVTIGPRELRFHESVGTATGVTPIDGGVRIDAAYEGEGERWTTRQRLTIAGNTLTIAGEGAPIRRVRCPG